MYITSHPEPDVKECDFPRRKRYLGQNYFLKCRRERWGERGCFHYSPSNCLTTNRLILVGRWQNNFQNGFQREICFLSDSVPSQFCRHVLQKLQLAHFSHTFLLFIPTRNNCCFRGVSFHKLTFSLLPEGECNVQHLQSYAA